MRNKEYLAIVISNYRKALNKLKSNKQTTSEEINLVFNRGFCEGLFNKKPKRSIKKMFKIYSYKITKFLMKLITPKERYEEKLDEMRKKRGSSDYAMLTTDVMRGTFNKVINLDLTNKLKDIEQSTLLVWGENDMDTPLYMAKIMEKNIKDSGIVVIENAGHFSYLDNPNKYLLVVSTFLNDKK